MQEFRAVYTKLSRSDQIVINFVGLAPSAIASHNSFFSKSATYLFTKKDAYSDESIGFLLKSEEPLKKKSSVYNVNYC
jgi:hypothetical protein